METATSILFLICYTCDKLKHRQALVVLAKKMRFHRCRTVAHEKTNLLCGMIKLWSELLTSQALSRAHCIFV